jgi:hypothetical protein
VNAEPHETEAVKDVLSTLLARSRSPDDATLANKSNGGPTLKDAIDAYRADKRVNKKLKARSSATYERVLRVVEEHFKGLTNLRSITQERFVSFATTIKDNDRADQTKNAYITIAAAFFS